MPESDAGELRRHLPRSQPDPEGHEALSRQSLRNPFAAHLLEVEQDIRTIQELEGHKDIKPHELYARAEPWPSAPRACAALPTF